MTALFLILAAMTIAGTAAAMSLRNAIHCILALTVGLVGFALLFLQLNAQFVGFTQVLVYVGAVAILAVFAIMMTRGDGSHPQPAFSKTWFVGGGIAAVVFAVLAWAILSHPAMGQVATEPAEITVNQIGDALMHRYVVPMEIMGLLLTAALIGAVVLAMPGKQEQP
ncbi:MAG: NADH-quinone oxidoreductase subunit J [Acidobacteriota bacterium]